MLKTITIALILGLTIWTIRAQDSECIRQELERELQEYVKLESWQQLFRRHTKLYVNLNSDVLSERKRLKFNTIIHNAIYGCDHNRDDEVDDCPNIYRGSIKSCKHGKSVRAAMFRAARCVFVESSVKHLVLGNALLDVYPSNKLDKLSSYVDKPIREFGETIVNVLATIGHGETGALGELMAMNLYLNNKFGTVLMHKIPAEPVASWADFQVARKRMRAVHGMILEKLYAFWDTWCSDRDIVTQYRRKYRDGDHVAVLREMATNVRETDDLVRGLNVSDHDVVDLDFDPNRIALTDYVAAIVSSRSMPDELSADVQLRSFEASYQFDPRELRAYHAFVFRSVYACFYWTTVTQLRLAARIVEQMKEHGTVRENRMGFVVNLAKFLRPLTVFDVNRNRFALDLSPAASGNLTALVSYLSRLYRALRRGYSAELILSSGTEARHFADLLSADMETLLNVEGPADYFENYDYDAAVKLVETNYQAFARLVSTTSGFKEDRVNLMKLKKYLFFLADVAEFDLTEQSQQHVIGL